MEGIGKDQKGGSRAAEYSTRIIFYMGGESHILMPMAGFINASVQIAEAIALHIGILFVDAVMLNDVLFKKEILQ